MSRNIRKKVLIREEERTDPRYGHIPEKRPINEYIRNSIINLDKPSGPSSHQVSAWVKKIFNVKKAGHGGTLDPAVTGVLPVAIENATKVMKIMLKGGKEYVAIMHLHGDADEETVKKALDSYIGKITQLPPKRSSVKRIEREREIYYIEFLDMQKRDVMFKVGCQHGTYVRRLCEQLGKTIGTKAHMIKLRRTKAGIFTENERLVTLHDLVDAMEFYKEDGNEKFLRYCLQPLETLLELIPKIWVFDSAVHSLCHGAKLAVTGISKLEDGIKKEDIVAVMTLKGEAIGIGTALMDSNNMKNEAKGLAVKMDRITMKDDTYPRM